MRRIPPTLTSRFPRCVFQDFEEWKAKVTKPAPKKQKSLSEKALRQATLTFGEAGEQPCQKDKTPSGEGKQGHKQQALREKNSK